MHIVAKASISFFMSARLSVYISAAPTGRIYVKFGTGDFYEHLSRKCKLGYSRLLL